MMQRKMFYSLIKSMCGEVEVLMESEMKLYTLLQWADIRSLVV
jgi:hypothetical protein